MTIIAPPFPFPVRWWSPPSPHPSPFSPSGHGNRIAATAVPAGFPPVVGDIRWQTTIRITRLDLT